MKKLKILSMLMLVAMASCGDKTKGVTTESDSTQTDSLMVADSVTAGPTDLWTTEAVESQIRACIAEVNQMAADDAIDITLLDLKYCSEDFLELKEKLYKKVRESKGQLMFDGDEGHHWVPGIGTPMIIDSVKTELLTGDQAQAEVWLRDKRGSKGYLEMNLYLENGAWKVHNWIDDDVYPFGSLWHWMQNFLDGDMDAEEHEEPDLNQYAE